MNELTPEVYVRARRRLKHVTCARHAEAAIMTHARVLFTEPTCLHGVNFRVEQAEKTAHLRSGLGVAAVDVHPDTLSHPRTHCHRNKHPQSTLDIPQVT
jgi:hypothetical protein